MSTNTPVTGERGIISQIDADYYWVKLDKDHPELSEWDNAVEIADWSYQDGPTEHPETYLRKLE